MVDLVAELGRLVGPANAVDGDRAGPDYDHDECLTVPGARAACVVRPGSTQEVAAVVTWARERRVPLTARGSATGLSGGCAPVPGGVVVSFERMNRIREIDLENHVAVVEPGVTLDELDKAAGAHGLVYPVFPGESSASLGGNVATNAGGMRAVKYGVTRHQVLGLTAVLGTGEVIRTGGKFVKSTSGYDLTQLITGSEGTLALVTEAILRLYPRPDHSTTVLAPFTGLEEITRAVPRIVASGVGPLVVEYIDAVSMAGILANAGLDLGIPDAVRERALAYLVVVLENRRQSWLDESVEELAELLSGMDAVDVYVLPPQAGTQLVLARERAFWAAKASGADDVLDMVIPRAEMSRYMQEVSSLAETSGSLVVACGHAGDGNVHLSVFQRDESRRHELIDAILGVAIGLGGAVSGEHGIGAAKKPYLARLEDPAKLDLMRRIKASFDPEGILNPGKVFDQ